MENKFLTKNDKCNVALCCIGKMENLYIKDYVEYYYNLGVNKIYLYDNNDIEGEHFEDVIDEYIQTNFVEITDFRGKTHCQLKAYQDCYDKHNQEYDWIIFIDCGDEYLHLEHHRNIQDFLTSSEFNDFDMLHINRMNYGDCDLVYYEAIPVMTRFHQPILPLSFLKTYSFPENYHVSSIIRGGREVKWLNTPHTPSNELKCCNALGEKVHSQSPFQKYDYTVAYFKHYTTKTIDEWLNIKTKRGYPDGNKDFFKHNDVVKEFFKYNKQTIDKMKFIEEFYKKNEE